MTVHGGEVAFPTVVGACGDSQLHLGKSSKKQRMVLEAGLVYNSQGLLTMA